MVLILDLELLLGWDRLPLYGCFGYVEMTKFLSLKIILSCRSSTCVHVCSVCGHLFSGWRIETYLWRCVHNWRLQRGILSPYMDSRIIYRSVHHRHLRKITIAQNDMYFVFLCFTFRLLDGCVHPVM
jgi:hypothetical protein